MITGDPSRPDKPDITYEEFAKVDLRVAEIVGAEFLKNKTNLIRLTVDLGYGRQQMVVGKGLPDLYAPAALIGQRIVWMANLKLRMISGLESQGMIVATGDNRVTGLVIVDKACALGARVR
jgi:methionine--tRNA ligase beta chain